MISTQKKGTITELQVTTYLLSLGYNVYLPVSSDTDSDCILEINGKLIKIQIKTSKLLENKNSIKFDCRSNRWNTKGCSHHHYTEEDIDFFATFWNQDCFLIPVKECSCSKTLWLIEPKQKNQSYCKDYLAEEVLKSL